MTPTPEGDPSSNQDRRTFLGRAGAAVVAAAWTGCATGQDRRDASPGGAPAGPIAIRVEAPADPLIDRAVAILRERIRERCGDAVDPGGDRHRILLAVDGRLTAEGFRVEPAGAAVRIVGGSPRGLLYGVGKFLRTSGYDGAFRPSSWRGSSAPHGTLRGMYFATHFHNWYHQASEPEIRRYLEDLTLWGVNAVMAIFPMINLTGWDDPEAEPAMARFRQYAQAAKSLGLKFVTGVNNCLFIDAPREIRATRLPDPTGRRGNSGHPVCPSIPEGHAYLLGNTRRLFEHLSDIGLDLLCHWPYDEGGCACDRCRPWGSGGYLRLSRDLTNLGREYFPKLQSILATWMFDTPPEGEWDGLAKAVADDRGWVDYILADAHEDFPRYPLDVGVPGRLPLLNFPEISMWGNWPWGGFGANPLPARVQRLWNQVKGRVAGGFPYSEGIYEDLNKALVSQFYWNPDRTARETLAEYAAYEYGAEVAEEAVQVIEALERAAASTYTKKPVDIAEVESTRRLADGIASRMPDWARRNWRWEIVHLRTILDGERFAGPGLTSPVAEAAMLRLMELYHCQMETDDPYHHRVRPPLKRAVSRRGQS